MLIERSSLKDVAIVSRDTKVQQWLTAARDGSHELATQLLEENPNLITAVDAEHKMTALHWATSTGQLGMVEFLLREKVDLTNAVDNEGMNALHWAASNRERALAVPLLLAANPASLHVLALGMTPLDRAIRTGDVEVTAQFFVADPSLIHRANGSADRLTGLRQAEGVTALHIAVARDCPTIVEQLLALLDPELVKAVDSQGRTALDVAVEAGHWTVVTIFLIEDPNLGNQVERLRGSTALHCAARGDYTEGVAKLLARHPHMVNAVDDAGRTALHVAARFGHSEVVAQLLAVMSPQLINVVAKNGETALLCAVSSFRGHLEITERLLDVATPEAINAVDGKGKTVLYYAAWHGKDKLVARLLAMSPGLIDQVTHEGGTVLHASARFESILEMLVALRPKIVHAVDNQDNTVLHSVVESPYEVSAEVIERLLVLNPDALRAINSKEQTPFDLALVSLSWQEVDSPAPVIKAMLVKLSLDEAVSAFAEHKIEHYEERFLCAVMERQCECLSSVLLRDVVGVVFEFLGLDSLKHPHKKQKVL